MRREHDHRAGGPEAAWVNDRTSERHPIRKHAILHCHDRVQTILVRDISAGGMKIQNAFGLIAGDAVRVELLTRRAFDGTVAWSVPPYCGIKFHTPLAENDPLITRHAPHAA
jgi:hypothetical protein